LVLVAKAAAIAQNGAIHMKARRSLCFWHISYWNKMTTVEIRDESKL
jgi:hypothetical protein